MCCDGTKISVARKTGHFERKDGRTTVPNSGVLYIIQKIPIIMAVVSRTYSDRAMRELYKGAKRCKIMTFPPTIKKLKVCAFSRVEHLRMVVMNDALTKIGDSAFARSGLREVTIPRHVKTLGSQAFKECRSLQKVLFCEGCRLERIGQECFRESKIREIALPPAVKEVQAGAFSRC